MWQRGSGCPSLWGAHAEPTFLLPLLPRARARSEMSEVGSSPLPTPVFTWEQNPKKAAWPVRRSPSLGWHIRNGPHSSVPCLSSPVRAAAGGFPSCLCSLSQALKVVQVTGAMPPALTLQPELTLCAQLWVRASLPCACLALLFQAFPLPPLGYADWIWGQRPHAAGMRVPVMPMGSRAGAGVPCGWGGAGSQVAAPATL